ncbi:MAG: cobalt-precorrin 5A hydrolase [Nitrospirota bacterium]
MNQRRIAIIAVTKRGVISGRRLNIALDNSMLFIPQHFKGDSYRERENNTTFFSLPLRDIVKEIFNRYDGIVFFLSIGAVIRLIAKEIRDKYTDPAIVVVDENTDYVISILSGHIGGANKLARDAASILNAKPVITTASDLKKTISIDILGKEFGWVIENKENIKRVSSSLVNEEVVGIFQDAGEKNWWRRGISLPENIRICNSVDAIKIDDIVSGIIITDKIIKEREIFAKSVIYRPKSLVVGIGCKRAVLVSDIEKVISASFKKHDISILSIRNIATIDIKDNEEAIELFVKKYNIFCKFFNREELNMVKGIKNPSERVLSLIGTGSVCEAAALLSSDAEDLLIPKVKTNNVTIAAARISSHI